MLAKRCIKFINNATNSCNNIVKTISNMGLYSHYSIMGANARHLEALYSTQVSNVQKIWSRFYESSQAMPTYRSYFD